MPGPIRRRPAWPLNDQWNDQEDQYDAHQYYLDIAAPANPGQPLENGQVVAPMHVTAQDWEDCLEITYEGDLMAKAGVSYHVRREGNTKYNETISGALVRARPQFQGGGRSLRGRRRPRSGLLSEISAADPGQKGDSDKRIQAYCFRMRLTKGPASRMPFPKPRNYDPKRYALLVHHLNKLPEGGRGFKPGGDVNNHHLGDGALFTDYVGGNYNWPDGDYATRERAF